MSMYALKHYWKDIFQFLLGTEGRKGNGVIFTVFTYINYVKLVGNISIVPHKDAHMRGLLWSLCVPVTCQYLWCMSSIWPRDTNKKRDGPLSHAQSMFLVTFWNSPKVESVRWSWLLICSSMSSRWREKDFGKVWVPIRSFPLKVKTILILLPDVFNLYRLIYSQNLVKCFCHKLANSTVSRSNIPHDQTAGRLWPPIIFFRIFFSVSQCRWYAPKMNSNIIKLLGHIYLFWQFGTDKDSCFRELSATVKLRMVSMMGRKNMG